MTGIIAEIIATQQSAAGVPIGAGASTGTNSPAFDYNFSTGVLTPGTTVTRASSATVQMPTGTLVVVGNNVPRLPFRLSHGSAPIALGLLLEPASNNLILHSDRLDTAANWTLRFGILTAAAAIGPLGQMNMVEITSVATFNEIFQPIGSVTAGVQYALTFFCRRGTGDTFGIGQFTELGSGWGAATYDLGNDIVASMFSNGWTVLTATMEAVGDGSLFKCSLIATPTTTKTTNVSFYLVSAAPQPVNTSWTATAGSTWFVSDVQVESPAPGGLITSYIPNTGTTTATRAAETASLYLGVFAGTLSSVSTVATFASVRPLPVTFIPGASIVISGATPSGYNGTFSILAVNNSNNTFTYTLGSPQTSPATGTPQASIASASYDVFQEDLLGNQWTLGVAVTSGAYALVPRAGQVTVTRARFWPAGLLTLAQRNQIAGIAPPPPPPPPPVATRLYNGFDVTGSFGGGGNAAPSIGSDGSIGNFFNGSWVKFSVDFLTGMSVWDANIGCAPGFAGQFFTLYIDPTITDTPTSGTQIGQLQVQNTGSFFTFTLQSTPITMTSGVHLLYIVASPTSGEGNLLNFFFSVPQTTTDLPASPLSGFTLTRYWEFGLIAADPQATVNIIDLPTLGGQFYPNSWFESASDSRTYSLNVVNLNLGIFNNSGTLLHGSQVSKFIGTFGYYEAVVQITGLTGTCVRALCLQANNTDGAAGTNGGNTSNSQIAIEFFSGVRNSTNQQVQLNCYQGSSTTPVTSFVFTCPFDPRAAFHRYGVNWTATTVQLFVDGVAQGPILNYVYSSTSLPQAPPDLAFSSFPDATTPPAIAVNTGVFDQWQAIRFWAASSTVGGGGGGGNSGAAAAAGTVATPNGTDWSTSGVGNTGHDKSAFGWTNTFLDDFDGVPEIDPTRGNTVQLYFDRTKWTSGFIPVAYGQDNAGDGSRYLAGNGEQQSYLDKDFGPNGLAPANRINPFFFANSIMQIETGFIPTALQSTYFIGGFRVFYSGCLETATKFSQQYGLFEAKIQMPTNPLGAWPAFWFLTQPTSLATNTWPPEIDCLEQFPKLRPTQTHYGEIHTASGGGITGNGNWATLPTGGNVSTAFHVYSMFFTPQFITWAVDGIQVGQAPTPAQANTIWYILLNVAVGGNWYQQESGNTSLQQLVDQYNADTTQMPYRTSYDWVRAYQVAPVVQFVGFFVSPSGNDANAGTVAAPFLTLEKAQTAMQNSTMKTTFLRSGSYPRAATLNLGSADNGTTWQYYPPDGVNTATIDGGFAVAAIFNITAASNITINGLKIQNATAFGIRLPDAAAVSSGLTVSNCDIGSIHSPGGSALQSAAIYFNNTTNTAIKNNYIHDCQATGIAVSAFNANDTYNGASITGNVVLRTCQTLSNDGGIYLSARNTGANAGNATVSNNYVKDFGAPGDDSTVGIYLGDSASHVTVSGNIIGPTNATMQTSHGQLALLISGGSNNTTSNNIIDLGGSSFEFAALYASPAASNIFTQNILISAFAGAQNTSYATVAVGQTYAETAGIGSLSISNNMYHNYSGGAEVTTGPLVSDASPIHANPQMSGYTYTLASTSPAFTAPMNFAPLTGGWGPPGFVIPQSGIAPSCLTETIGGGTIATAAIGPAPAAPTANVGSGWTLVKNWHFGTQGTITSNAILDQEFNYHDEFGVYDGAGHNYGSLTIATSAATALSGQPVEDPTRPIRTFTATEMRCALQSVNAAATTVTANTKDCVNGSVYSKFALPNAGSLLGQDILWEFSVRLFPVQAFWSAIWNEGNPWNQGPEIDVYETYGWDHGSQGNNFNCGNFHSDIVTSGGPNGSTSNTSLNFVNYNSYSPNFNDGSNYHRFNLLYKKDNTWQIYMDDNLINFGTYFWTTGGQNGGPSGNPMYFQHDFAWGFVGNLGTVNGVVNQGMNPANFPVSNFSGKSYGIQYSRVYLR